MYPGLSDRSAIKKVSRYLKEKIACRTGYGVVPVLGPVHCFVVVIDRYYQVDVFLFHAGYVFFTRTRQSSCRPELSVGMIIPDYLQAIELCQYRFNFLVALIE